MKVEQAMHKGVEWVVPTTPIRDVAQLMSKHDVGSIPVGENDKLVGMVTDRDIVCRGLAEGKDWNKLTAGDIMTKGIVVCRADQSVDEAVNLMEQKKLRRLPVVDGDKRMVGMLSLGDVSHAASEDRSGQVLKTVSAHHTR